MWFDFARFYHAAGFHPILTAEGLEQRTQTHHPTEEGAHAKKYPTKEEAEDFISGFFFVDFSWDMKVLAFETKLQYALFFE